MTDERSKRSLPPAVIVIWATLKLVALLLLLDAASTIVLYQNY